MEMQQGRAGAVCEGEARICSPEVPSANANSLLPRTHQSCRRCANVSKRLGGGISTPKLLFGLMRNGI